MKIRASLLDANPELAKFSESIIKILEANTLCTLATINKNGTPHANTAYYAVDSDLNIYLLTEPSTQHSQNIARNKNLAMTIFESKQPWGKPHRGLQLGGVCGQVSAKDQEKVFTVYATKHPELLNLVRTSSRLLKELESRFYMVNTTWIKLIDEQKYGMETHFLIQLKK